MIGRMNDRRHKRSAERDEALQFLVESVADRSGARALVLLDQAGSIVAGVGKPSEVEDLVFSARDVACKRAAPEIIATMRHDVTARVVATSKGTHYLAALCDRMTGLGEATKALHRILAA
jgi:hypothetical protein